MACLDLSIERFLEWEILPILAFASGEMAKEAPLDDGMLPMEDECEREHEGVEAGVVEALTAARSVARRGMRRVERIMMSVGSQRREKEEKGEKEPGCPKEGGCGCVVGGGEVMSGERKRRRANGPGSGRSTLHSSHKSLARATKPNASVWIYM